MTKAVLCKEESYEVSDNDCKLVRQYLDEHAVCDTLHDYETTFDIFIKDFAPIKRQNEHVVSTTTNSKNAIRNCVRQAFARKSNAIGQMRSNVIGSNNVDEHLKENMHKKNKYDEKNLKKNRWAAMS